MMPFERTAAGARGRQTIRLDERRVAILQVLAAGWWRALKSPHVDPDATDTEVPITESLRRGMRSELNESDAPWCRKMTILPGTESSSSPDVVRPDGIVDIPVFFADIRERLGEHDPHAIIECKRVSGGHANLCRLYVTEGIDRFASGKYAGNHTDGFMVGYLISGDTESAVTGINAYLTRSRRCREHLGSCQVFDAPWARSSIHGRPEPPAPIELHHAFFGFSLLPV